MGAAPNGGFNREQLLICKNSALNCQLGRARGHRPYQSNYYQRSRAGTLALQLSTLSGGHGGTAPTNSQSRARSRRSHYNSQLSTLNSQLSTINSQLCA
ncbi:MAG: hypothetical protein ACRC62_19370 [Microcoleus sp.]